MVAVVILLYSVGLWRSPTWVGRSKCLRIDSWSLWWSLGANTTATADIGLMILSCCWDLAAVKGWRRWLQMFGFSVFLNGYSRCSLSLLLSATSPWIYHRTWLLSQVSIETDFDGLLLRLGNPRWSQRLLVFPLEILLSTFSMWVDYHVYLWKIQRLTTTHI